ncbi:MAG: PAS domain S-box protein [Steroidobacteraceae bacterium]
MKNFRALGVLIALVAIALTLATVLGLQQAAPAAQAVRFLLLLGALVALFTLLLLWRQARQALRNTEALLAHEAEIERLNRLYNALAQVNQAIVWAGARQQLFDEVCRILAKVGGFRFTRLMLFSAERNALLPAAENGDGDYVPSPVSFPVDDSPLGQGPSATAFRDGRPFISNDLLADPAAVAWLDSMQQRGFRSGAIFPIRMAGQVCGTISVYAGQLDFFRDKEIELLLNVAGDLSFALDNLARMEERRAAQAVLNRLAAIVASTDDAIASSTLDGIVTSWNAGAEAIYGYSAAEMIGQNFSRVIPPDRPGEAQHILRHLGSGEHISNFESLRLRKDGSRVPISATLTPIWEEEQGTRRVVGTAMIARDISERLRSEAIAQRERQFSDALLKSTPGIFYLYNRSGRFLRWNSNFAIVTGYDDAEIAQMHPLQFFCEDEKLLLQTRIEEVFERGHAFVEARLRAKSGHTTPYFFTGQQLSFDGETCLVGVGLDISARKSAEADLADHAARLQAISRQLMAVQENERRLLARDLHDTVGQELTALGLNLAFIREAAGTGNRAALDARLRDSLALIGTTTRHLRDIMVELRPPGLDELGLLAALKEHATRVAQRSGLRLSVTGAQIQPPLSTAVAIALFRIAQEAMNNTVKHGDATALSIELLDDASETRLIIGDDGRGFDTTQRAPPGGGGMGMTTMRERAEACGAQLSVRSLPGQGTQVLVSIPHTAAGRQP